MNVHTRVSDVSVKSSELARLFEFFDSLAAYRARKQLDTKAKGDGEIAIPEDIAPVLQKIETLAAHRADSTQNAVSEVKDIGYSDTVPQQAKTKVATFPLEKRYSFTFKMMLYKLYELEEWAKKIKEEVERSKLEYKPLAEVTTPSDTSTQTEAAKSLGDRIDLASALKSARKEVLRTPLTRQQRPSTSGPRVSRYGQLASPMSSRMSPRFPKSPRFPVSIHAETTNPATKVVGGILRLPDDTIVKKKRCVGRSKSMTKLASIASAHPNTDASNAWVYQAAISCVEVQHMDARQPLHEVHPTSNSRETKRSIKQRRASGANDRLRRTGEGVRS